MTKPTKPKKPDGRRGKKDKPWTRLPRLTTRTGARIGRKGERVSDFASVTLRAPRPLHARLLALADVKGEPLWALLVQAAEAFLQAQDEPTRAAVETRARRIARTRVEKRAHALIAALDAREHEPDAGKD